jgi:hypothetical protein
MIACGLLETIIADRGLSASTLEAIILPDVKPLLTSCRMLSTIASVAGDAVPPKIRMEPRIVGALLVRKFERTTEVEDAVLRATTDYSPRRIVRVLREAPGLQ